MTKAQTPRQTQLRLLYSGAANGKTESANSKFSHPDYWTPFILMATQ